MGSEKIVKMKIQERKKNGIKEAVEKESKTKKKTNKINSYIKTGKKRNEIKEGRRQGSSKGR